MDFNATIDIILKDLREVREIIDDLKNYPGLPRLQVELAKAKCRSAEEVIALLKDLKPAESKPDITNSQEPVREIATQKPPIQKQPEPIIDLIKEKVRETEKLSEKEKKEPEQISVPDNSTPAKDNAAGKTSSTIIADKFTGHAGTISDRFESDIKGEDLASAIKRSKPVGSLENAIGLSDKFLFIREIFGGKQQDYEQAIDKLNRAETIQDARAIIMSYTGENEENDAVVQLLEIVNRKLPSDG
jgi:hypothetical protein